MGTVSIVELELAMYLSALAIFKMYPAPATGIH